MMEVLSGDAVERLREMREGSVQCCVTSPPYWGLRDYGTAEWEGGDEGCDHLKPFDAVSHLTSTLNRAKDPMKDQGNTGHKHEGYRYNCGKCGAVRVDSQLGLEKTPEEYVAKMVAVFREVRRVLRKDGTCWINLGDSYANTGLKDTSKVGGFTGDRIRNLENRMATGIGNKGVMHCEPKEIPPGLKPKDLCGIPWRVAFALQADGWWLRSDIIWSKPNPMPESVTDRPTKAHEYLFLLTKSANYFYDAEAIKEPHSPDSREITTVVGREGSIQHRNGERWPGSGRNKRSVWTVATAPYPEAHFATYPPDLIKPCIMAGTSAKGCCAKCGAPWERIVESEKTFESGSGRAGNLPIGKQDLRASDTNSTPDIRLGPVVTTKTLGWQPTCECDAAVVPCAVLDPFAGSGTTGMVALELGRKATLIELNPHYVALIEQRCDVTMGLALA